MKRPSTIVIATLLAAGCASTNAPTQTAEQKREAARAEMNVLYDRFNLNAQQVKPSTSEDYTKSHEGLGKAMGVEQHVLESELGKFFAISKTGQHWWAPQEHEFFVTAGKLFSDSCAGESHYPTAFERADSEGLFNPLNYATAEELELMKKHSISTATKTSEYDEYENYLRLSSRERTREQRKKYTLPTYGNYSIFFLKNVDFTNSGLSIPTAAITSQKTASKACYVDGKITGYQIAFTSYVNAGNRDRITPVENSHAMTIYYIPAETVDALAKRAFQERRDNLARQLPRIQVEEAKRLARKRAIEENDLAGAQNWTQRLNQTFVAGDRVCTPDNKMGFVEQANDENVKVWFRGQLIRENENYFFGNSRKMPDSRFDYRRVNEQTWVQHGEVATCNFKLNIN